MTRKQTLHLGLIFIIASVIGAAATAQTYNATVDGMVRAEIDGKPVVGELNGQITLRRVPPSPATRPTPPPATRPMPALARLVIVDAKTGKDIGPLTDGMTIDAGGPLNFRADLSNAASVSFLMSGEGDDARVESSSPYYAFGDVNGTPKLWAPPIGSRTLVVTPFEMKAAGGAAGPSQTFRFTVTASTPPLEIPEGRPTGTPPSAKTTGVLAGTDLQPAGNLKIQSGKTYVGLSFKGMVDLQNVSNVTFISCLFDADGDSRGARCDGTGKNRVFRSCEFRNMADEAVFGSNYQAIGCYVHMSKGDGFKAKENVLIEGNYVTQLGMAAGAHADGVQSGGSGSTDVTIRGNFFDMPVDVPGTKSNVCLMLHVQLKNVVVEGNWFRGGKNYTIHFIDDGNNSGNRCINNVFHRGQSGTAFARLSSRVEFAGNVDERGRAVTAKDN